MTTFLRFPDEVCAIACMGAWYQAARPDLELPAVWCAPEDGWAVDVIGEISIGGEWNADGVELVAPEVLPGWHLNVLGEIPEAALPYQVSPAVPYRKFAE